MRSSQREFKGSSAGLEKRKHSAPARTGKGGHSASAKSSPAREMAPFFSIFYRGITKINRSQSKADQLDREPGEKGGGKSHGGAEAGGMERSQSSRKFVDKPPLPSKSKGAAGGGGSNVGGDVPHRKSTTTATTIRSRSTIDLAKEKAAAEGKMWREQQQPSAPSSPEAARKKISSAPGSPQGTRRWPFSFLSSSKAQSQEPVPLPSPPAVTPSIGTASQRQNGHQQQQNGFHQHRKQRELPPMAPQPTGKPPSPHPQQQQLTFAQRIRLHKGVRTGKIPVDALKQQNNFFLGSGAKPAKGSAKKSMPGGVGGAGLYMSADAIHELSTDPDYIAEALRTLGDEQPKVARSTPKHAYISQDPKRIQDRLRRDCLYPQDVYEKMVKDSLLVCDLLQSHLDDVISGVRAKSPSALSSPFTTPPGSPFMTRSTSLHFAGSTAPINRVTISVSPMAQQANPQTTPRPSGSSLPPFPTSPTMSPPPPPMVPLVRVTPASFRGSEKRLQFVS